ncbi:MAG: hypothetical protein JSR34_05380 [Proteobacteria bacterium]|nr:hypothetical protein [Pseudomonadota bacterium]
MNAASPAALRSGRPHAAAALLWLHAMSLYNNLRQRLLRLRQPKYLFGALAALAYFYLIFGRRLGQDHHPNTAHTVFALTAAQSVGLGALAATAVALLTLAIWLFADGRARLAFSEAEIAFLFPAPLTRTTLIHYALLRAQLGIAFSALLLSIVLHRGSALGIHRLHFAIGYWLLMSMGQLHELGAAFTRERLLDLGLRPWRRRALVATLAVLLALICWWPLRGVLHLPETAVLADPPALLHWFDGIAGTAPLSWLLTPFRWAVAPLFATEASAFWLALLPALGLLIAHYLWVVRAQVSFEDASLAFARRRAERLAALRAGNLRERKPTKPRGEPFRLVGSGFAPIAFLWKGLIAMGGFYRLRSFVIACVAAYALCRWLAADPARQPVLIIVGTLVAMLGAWLLLLAPMLFSNRLRGSLQTLDILKSAPLPGWQIALGEVLAPWVVMSCLCWLLLLVGVQAGLHGAEHTVLAPNLLLAAAVGMGLLAPLLCGLMLCLPFAGMLYFPAWSGSGTAGGRGFEVMGQRLILMGGYMVAMVLAMLPVALPGGLVWLLGERFGSPQVGALLAGLSGAGVLVFELVLAFDLLGRRIDAFDVSQELR